MHKKIHILLQPPTILISTGILFFIFFGFAWFEFQRSNQDILSIMKEEGHVLLDALMTSSERSILAYEELERLIQNRLFESGFWLDAMENQNGLNQKYLNQIADTLGVYRIDILNSKGERVLGNTLLPAERIDNQRDFQYRELFAPILKGQRHSMILGFREDGYQEGPRTMVAVRRQRGGVIILTADSRKLLDVRKKVGPGRLVQEIGGRPGVAYVILQDTVGIIMANKDVVGMSRILDDPFLNQIYTNQSRGSRIDRFQERSILEVTASFWVEENQLGLLRVGLEMDHYREIVRKARYRLLFIGFIFVFVGIIGFNLFMANQNVRLLSESYQRVKTHTGEILQNLEDGVIALDGTGKITLFNQASENLFHVTRKKVIGKMIQSLSLPCKKIILESFESGKARSREETCMIRGKKRILAMRTSLVTGNHGSLEAVILVATDLTHQHQLEVQLQRQEKLRAMGELASGVAHEIRNPINAIGMIGQRFRKEFRPKNDEEEYHKLADAIVKEVRRINDIIQRFLRFARPSKLERSRVNMRRFLQEVSKFFESSAQNRGVKFSVKEIARKEIALDRDQMKQALLNILNNALDASSEGDHITLLGGVVEESYWIEISDEGDGMDEHEKEKIFDLYYTTKPEGTGMGLPIVLQIVQSHRGEIDVETEKGKGSLFRIRLPLDLS